MSLRGGQAMSSKKRAITLFSSRRLDAEEFTIGHLTDEAARLYARDLFLIGYVEESQILSGNDKSRYTAILSKDSGQACEVFFDLPAEPLLQAKPDVRGRKEAAQIPH
jgi:hypothetical protein